MEGDRVDGTNGKRDLVHETKVCHLRKIIIVRWIAVLRKLLRWEIRAPNVLDSLTINRATDKGCVQVYYLKYDARNKD